MSNERPSLAIDFNGFIEAAQALKDRPALETKIADLESQVSYLQANNDATHSAYQALTDQHGEKISRIKELEAALADATFRERQVRDQLHTVQQAVSSLVSTITPPAPEPVPVPTGTGTEPVAVRPESDDFLSSPKPTTSFDDDDDILVAALKKMWEEAENKNPAPFDGAAAPIPTVSVQGSGTAASSDPTPRLEKEFIAGYSVNEDGSTTPMGQSETPFAPSTDAPSDPAAYPSSSPESPVEPSAAVSKCLQSTRTPHTHDQ